LSFLTQALHHKLETVERNAGAAEEGDSGREAAGAPQSMEEEDELLPRDELSPDVAAAQGLFSGCVFFCGRETPVASLEFVILSCGGAVAWDGEGSPMTESNEAITHQARQSPLALWPSLV